jgi:hypothetical protein
VWKTTKRLKTVPQISTPLRTPQRTWARTNADKAQAFANHLASVFQPHPPEPDSLPDWKRSRISMMEVEGWDL